jgi:tetratricopeptide (TPR) repeat protein
MDKAAGEIERAEKLAPNNADILLNAAWLWPALGRPDHAVGLAGRALRLNPHYPYWYIQGLYYIYFFGKDFETSFGYAKRVTSPVASDLAFIAANAAYLGRLDEAKAMADRIAALDSKWSAEQWLSDQGGLAREEDAELLAEGARKARVRACLSATELKERPSTRTLNSCNAERARS